MDAVGPDSDLSEIAEVDEGDEVGRIDACGLDLEDVQRCQMNQRVAIELDGVVVEVEHERGKTCGSDATKGRIQKAISIEVTLRISYGRQGQLCQAIQVCDRMTKSLGHHTVHEAEVCDAAGTRQLGNYVVDPVSVERNFRVWLPEARDRELGQTV